LSDEARIARIQSRFPAEWRDFVRDLLTLRNARGAPLSSHERIMITKLFADPLGIMPATWFTLYERFIIAPELPFVRALEEIGWRFGPVDPEQIKKAVAYAAGIVRNVELRRTPPMTVRPSWDTDDD